MKLFKLHGLKLIIFDYYFAQMFHGQVNGQVICFFTRSFDLA